MLAATRRPARSVLLPLSLVAISLCTALAADDFRPSVRGKKLLLWAAISPEYARQHAPSWQSLPIDGLLMGGPMVFYQRLSEADIAPVVAELRQVPWGRLTDNFWIVYEFSGEKPDQFDWFDDCSWVISNWRLVARLARQAGLRGIMFDTEKYAGIGTFAYQGRRYAGEKSLEEYRAQVRRRGAEIMQAVAEEYPDITILFTVGPTQGGLLADFVDGMLSVCPREATLVDGYEQAYWSRIPPQFARGRAEVLVEGRDRSAVPDLYRRHVRAAFGLWDAPGVNLDQGRTFDVSDFQANYRTPDELAYALHWALAYSDEYVWMWHSLDWLGGVVEVLRDGQKTRVPIPSEYLAALHNARKPVVPLPPARTRPSAPGIVSVPPPSQLDGGDEEKAFADLWDTFSLVTDMPRRWRFRLDPADGGTAAGWWRPGYNDGRWAWIRIGDFWEAQGYAPEDGVAWYRVRFTPPPTPPDTRLYLAFGGISDGATVWVNGTQLPVSGVGRRGNRFLVEVSEVLRPRQRNLVAVRVFDWGWVGGIYGQVKLVAGPATSP
ncbi:MAG: hypothetical protein HPY69_04870 [Armatimonadetes bacterium]|nr:hypothetical protein [Armatimonadota bacterium]